MELKDLAPWNWFKKKKKQSAEESLKSGNLAPRNKQMNLVEEVNQVFDSGLDDHFWSSFSIERPVTPLTDPGLLRPYIDISANSREYLITVETPGVKKQDIELVISNNTLIIKGEVRQEQEERQKRFYRIQRSFGEFQRAVSLPEDADQEHLQAHFKKGRLYITLPRKEKSSPAKDGIAS